MLNANIPLNTKTPIRQQRWRIGLFLGLAGIGLFFGWIGIKRIFTGVLTPTLQTPSGITIRTTPEHTLWLATHTQGFTINTSCPIDIPTLVSHKNTSWLLLGNSEQEQSITFLGKIPPYIENFTKAFGCKIKPIKNGFALQDANDTTAKPKLDRFFHWQTPDSWAWNESQTTKIDLYERGINIHFTQSVQNKETAWPEQTLSAALPIEKLVLTSLPQTWQGLTNLLEKGRGIAYFSWETSEGLANAFSLQSDINDNEIISLFYVIGDLSTTTQKNFRKDGTTYTGTAKEPITLTWINDVHAEIQKENGSLVGFVTKQNSYTLVSTAPTTWTFIMPHWKAPLRENSSKNIYTANTIANFGEEIFVTKKMLSIFQRKL
jgi:hypothetical protein